MLALPSGLVVNQVNGSTVGDWESNGGLLRVRPLDPVASDMSFVVQGEMRVPREGAIVVPLVRMPSAERETGGIAVDVVGAGEMSGRQARGSIRPIRRSSATSSPERNRRRCSRFG